MPRPAGTAPADVVLDNKDASLLDLLDNALNKGIVLTGEITLGLAQIDLIYARLSVLLCAADRILPPEDLPDHGRKRRKRSPPRRMR